MDLVGVTFIVTSIVVAFAVPFLSWFFSINKVSLECVQLRIYLILSVIQFAVIVFAVNHWSINIAFTELALYYCFYWLFAQSGMTALSTSFITI